MKKTLIAAALITLATNAQAKSTLIEGMDIEGAEMVAEWTCDTLKGQIIDNDDHFTTCEFPMPMGQTIAYQMLMGNSYSTTPMGYMKYKHREGKKGVRMSVTGWVELQMAFGQMKRTNYEPKDGNAIIAKVDEHYEQGGTTDTLYELFAAFEKTIAENSARKEAEKKERLAEKGNFDPQNGDWD